MENVITIIPLRKNDLALFKTLIALLQDVFEEEAGNASDAHLQKLLSKPDFMAFCAMSGEQIIGGLTAYELLNYTEDASEAFIYDIAVDPAFQRKGIGKQLLSALREHCKKNNIRLVFVAANEEDRHALDFYHSAGGAQEKVIHFNFEV